MNCILLTQKCRVELKEKYLRHINNTSSEISFLDYINELFNPSGRGIIYTKISQEPLKIKIWSQSIEMLLEECPEKMSFKAISIRSVEIERFNRILKYADLLEGEWNFELVTSDTYSEGEFDFIRDKECFNEKKQEFDAYNKYWIDSDIITKKREEKSKEEQKKSITHYVNFAINFDKNTIMFKLKENKYKFKENQRIRISTKFIREPNIFSTTLVGQVANFDVKKNELIIESLDTKILEFISEEKEFKKGYLFVDDIGTMVMLKRQKNALQSLFNRNTANKNLKDFIPDINQASDIKFEFINKRLLSDEFIKMNDSQKTAIIRSIECKDINLIQGPPGTGKTTVICEIVKYLAKDNKSALISSQNNLAVDNVLQRIGEEDSVRAIRVGKEEKFELGCEKYALSNRVEFLQNEIINNIDNINTEYSELSKYVEANLELYNAYISSQESIKLLLKLTDNYNQHDKIHKSLETQLNHFKKNINDLNNEVLEYEKTVGNNVEDINYLSNIFDEYELSRNELYNYTHEILNLNTDKEDLDNVEIYSQIKNAIEFLSNDYKEIDNKIQNEKENQDKFKSQFEDIKSKIISLTVQKEQLSKGVEKHIDTKIEIFKEELIGIKEEYRRKEFDIRALETNKHSIYNKILELKKEIDICKLKIERIISLNTSFNLSSSEIIKIVKARNYIERKANERNVNIELIKHIQKSEGIKDLYLQKNKLEDEINNITKEIDRELKYLNSFKESIEKYISEYSVKVVFKNENISVENLTSSVLEKVEKYIQLYKEKEKYKKLLDKTNTLRKEWKDNMSYYQKSFEDVYIGISNVICATCSGIASSDNNNFIEKEFDYIIVDEAAKCFSSELLIPIIKGKKIILVGDHKQLSPIVEKDILEEMEENEDISREEIKNYYNNSLFGIMFKNANESIKTTLDIQYRMNTDISKFVSKQYYQGKLKDGPNIINLNHGIPKFDKGVYWIDTIELESSRENIIGTSYYNEEESKIIINLLKWLDTNLKNKKEIGIISPYSAQKTYLLNLLSGHNFNHIALEINTVDAFQGREKEIVIMNCVRNNSKGEFGHVSGDSRMNVAISRAQELLFIIGSKKFIQSNKNTSRSMYPLINYLEKNNSIISKDLFNI